MNRLPLAAVAAAVVALSSSAFAAQPDAGEHPLALPDVAPAPMAAAGARVAVAPAPLAGNLPADADAAAPQARAGRSDVSAEGVQALRLGRLAVGEQAS